VPAQLRLKLALSDEVLSLKNFQQRSLGPGLSFAVKVKDLIGEAIIQDQALSSRRRGPVQANPSLLQWVKPDTASGAAADDSNISAYVKPGVKAAVRVLSTALPALLNGATQATASGDLGFETITVPTTTIPKLTGSNPPLGVEAADLRLL